MEGTCAVCRKPARQRCSVCRLVNYCGKDHQKQHWKVHKNECRCYEVATSDKLGRYMVATRNISAGEVIVKEPPLVCGPKVSSYPQCLGCYRSLLGSSLDDETPKSFYHCGSCNWPLCSPRCENTPLHQLECKILAKGKRKTIITYKEERQIEPAYSTIVPLRCLLLPPEKLNEVLSLASNFEALINTPLYNVFKVNIVGYIHKALGLTQHSEETILKIAAVMDTNSFEVRREKENVKIRALYPKAAMLSHDCKPNTKHIFVGDNFTIAVVATTDIKKGETISATYTQTLWSTQARRQHLKMSKCFDCDCSRCLDPTEFGTYFSCILCSKCRGYMVCENPLEVTSNWKCDKCSHVIKAKQMAFGNETLKRELENTGKTIPTMGALLQKYLQDDKSVLHPNNCHIIQAKHALVQLYGANLTELDTEKLNHAESLCHDLLNLAEVLDPGMTRFRGSLLYDLQAIKVINIKTEFEKDLITKDKAQELLAEAAQLLQEAAAILKSEPDMVDQLELRVKELSQLCST